jgi:hypothetical protein
MWHLAMGIELWSAEPGALSNSLPAVIARELRERLLSRLGLAVRDRSAEQISRDRWTVRAVSLAARLAELDHKSWRGQRVARRLSTAVGKAQVGANAEQRRALLDLLAARRHATALATVPLQSPWESTPETAPEAAQQPVADRHESAAPTATETTQSATDIATEAATVAPQERRESAPEARPKRSGKAAQKRSAASPRAAAKDAIRSLYDALQRRPVEAEMVAALKAIKSPFDSPAFAKKIRAEIEKEHPHLAALGQPNVLTMTGTDS